MMMETSEALGTASPRLLDALAFAVDAHGRVAQARKGTTFPYTIHPIRVAEILYRHARDDEDLVVAGLLHDTVEDTGVTLEEIEKRFGARVARLVAGASEVDTTLPWAERKGRTLEGARTAELDVLHVVAADKLDNVRSIRDSLLDVGADATWGLFSAPRSAQRRYYTELARTIADRDPANGLFQALAVETEMLFPPDGPSSRFFHTRELRAPAAVRPLLGDPKRHWKPRFSAYELAHAWIGAGGIPGAVRGVLDTAAELRGAELAEGWFERETALGTPGRPTQTDLLALLRLPSGYAILAVEGKAAEPFGHIVAAWNTSDGRENRLVDLCAKLGLDRARADSLRYQLLHRTAAALIEAQRYGARHAVMLVHSFSDQDVGLADYRAFAAALGVSGADPDRLSEPKTYDDVELRLGWVADRPQPAA